MAGFRVVVLGAGPAGLFIAHALAGAGIDFVVLERQAEIVRYRGALLVVWPPFVRLLDQLGLYESALEHSTPMTSKTNFTHADEPLCQDGLFASLKDEFGYPTLGLSRGNLLRILYENLPEHKTKVRANANVVKVETLDDGVRVHMADGTTEEGSIVIAADGVHSATRGLIQGASGSSAAGALMSTSPMVATYLSLFGSTSGTRDDILCGDFAESHGPGTISQSIRLRDAMYFTVLKRLDEPAPDQKKFTSQELDEFVQGMPDLHLFPGVKLKEIWPMREQANAVLLHQEEGIAEKWHCGRVVIVGDAAHKMTSVNGMGALCAILSATTLANKLQATLKQHDNKNTMPSTEDLEATFAQYEAARKEPAKEVVDQGMRITRFASWAGGKNAEAMDKAMSRQNKIIEETRRWVTKVLGQSPVLNFIPFEGKHGTTPWEVEVPVKARL